MTSVKGIDRFYVENSEEVQTQHQCFLLIILTPNPQISDECAFLEKGWKDTEKKTKKETFNYGYDFVKQKEEKV